jgi:polyferredoxin
MGASSFSDRKPKTTMVQPVLIGWAIAVLFGLISGYKAYQKETEVEKLWGLLMIASSIILGFLGVAISVILFFLFVNTSKNTGKTGLEY